MIQEVEITDISGKSDIQNGHILTGRIQVREISQKIQKSMLYIYANFGQDLQLKTCKKKKML